ncbi:MAG TPA: 4Fe-4S dicluster domain-containing protein [Armatimonadota bacterium]|nr:4Fe-4S dicluster domain-containing protein [Armatimonadota bacterium]
MSDRKYHSGNQGLADKLGLVRYETDADNSHLKARSDAVCGDCDGKPCIGCCPAEVYRWDDDGPLEVAYENCLECGVCKIVCPFDNIEWEYPRGGYGLSYKHG